MLLTLHTQGGYKAPFLLPSTLCLYIHHQRLTVRAKPLIDMLAEYYQLFVAFRKVNFEA
jgi:hypothetical protein